jgi:hypothetical protein
MSTKLIKINSWINHKIPKKIFIIHSNNIQLMILIKLISGDLNS